MPETVDINHVRLTGRPVIISDVDDLVLKFIEPFQSFLESREFRFLPRSFRLNGNIVGLHDETPAEAVTVAQLLDDFFAEQHQWQTPFDHALDVLTNLDGMADIVFLTAMPPQFATQRRKLLDSIGLRHAMVATKVAKGPVARRIINDPEIKSAFLDDMAHNLASVGAHLPQCLLIHMPPDSPVHLHAPQADERARKARGWTEAQAIIMRHFG